MASPTNECASAGGASLSKDSKGTEAWPSAKRLWAVKNGWMGFRYLAFQVE